MFDFHSSMRSRDVKHSVPLTREHTMLSESTGSKPTLPGQWLFGLEQEMPM